MSGPGVAPVSGPGAVPPGGPPADTAGVGWGGRTLPTQPFAGDDGGADPALAAALVAHAAGTASLPAAVAALAGARVLVPVVAVLGEEHPLPAHARGDLGADMAIVTLTGPDGRRALPVFSSTATLARWDPAARPVPVDSARAALAAVAEDCELLLLDPAGPHPLPVPRPAVWALGRGRSWTPPGDDGELLAAVRAAVHPLPDVRGVRAEPLGDTGVRVVLGVTAGLTRPELDAVVHAARALLAEVELLAERAEAVELRVLPA